MSEDRITNPFFDPEHMIEAYEWPDTPDVPFIKDRIYQWLDAWHAGDSAEESHHLWLSDFKEFHSYLHYWEEKGFDYINGRRHIDFEPLKINPDRIPKGLRTLFLKLYAWENRINDAVPEGIPVVKQEFEEAMSKEQRWPMLKQFCEVHDCFPEFLAWINYGKLQ